jgi:hypothetical protein
VLACLDRLVLGRPKSSGLLRPGRGSITLEVTN